MSSANKAGKHPAGKARISGRRVKQPHYFPQSPFTPTNTAANRAPLDSLALAKIDDNVVAGEKLAVSSKGTAKKPTTQLFLIGPCADGVNSFDCPAMLDLLDVVRQRHTVRFDNVVPFPDSLVAHGQTLDGLRSACNDIRGFVHRLVLPGQNQIFMVQPSDDRQRKVVFLIDANNLDMARPSLWGDPYAVKIESVDDKILLQHAAAFRKQFGKLSNTICTAPCNLHMQVHLGKLLIPTQDGPSLLNAGGGAAQLDSALASSTIEDNIVFDRRIGNLAAFRAFQRQIFRSEGTFYPLSSVAENLKDVQPQQFLVGVMEGLRFELEIGPPFSAPDGRSAKLSDLRVFQTMGTEYKVGLTTACLDYHIDWKVETTPELKPGEFPATIKEFLKCVTVVHLKDHGEFPTPIVRAGASKEHRIKQLLGKTAWTVGFKGTQYRLELNRYHKFLNPRQGLEDQDQVLMGVSIWNSSWEEILRPTTSTSERDLGVDWKQLFRSGLRDGRNENGIITFLQLVYRVLGLCDRVCDEVSLPVAHTSVENAGSSNMLTTHDDLPRVNANSQSCSAVRHLSTQKASGSRSSCSVVEANGNRPEEDLLIFD